LAGSASKTATLQIQAVGLNNTAALASSSGGYAYLSLLVSNPSSAAIGINGFTLGSLSCVFSSPISVPAGTQGEMLNITLTIANGAFTDVNVNGASATCSGTQAAQVGIQYSGYITTVSGQTYPFTVTAAS